MMLNVMTIDVEDYYHVSAFESGIRFQDWERFESRVERNTHRILDLLDAHRTKATFFVLGWVAERQHNLIRLIHQRGHEVASHGYSHQRIYTQTPEKFREETKRSKQILEDAIGQAVIGYRAASYSITSRSLWALEILVEEGFRYDSSVFPIYHDIYGIPDESRFCYVINGRDDGKLIELPLSTVRMGGINFPVAGGGYLRLFPYPLTRWGIRRINDRDRQPAVVYLHPWEIDPEQPRIGCNWQSRFRHYTGLAQTERVLRRLLSEFQFGPVRDVLAQNGFDHLLKGTGP